MSKKHVLIVDDAKDILFLLKHTVKRLGPDYVVSTASDAPAALEQIQRQQFDLILTDYMMPGMTGLELAQEIRRISPDTQVVLMTAHDTVGLRDTVEDMELGGYVGKPFTVPQIQKMVRGIVAQTQQVATREPEEPLKLSQAVYDQLKTLYHKTGAHYVLLLSSEGRPLQVVGQTDRDKVSRLATFVAGNFLAVAELASLVGDSTSSFKSSYHEGSNYNIYAYDINRDFLLAIVFGTGGKPGTVWFYTKQAATALIPLLGSPSPGHSDDAVVANEFEDLLGDDASDLKKI